MMLNLKLQYFGHLMRRVDSLEKTDAGRDCGQEEKGTTEDEKAGWHPPLDGHEFEWTLGVGDGQGGLVCCDSWGRNESDMTEWLNWTELKSGRWVLIFSSNWWRNWGTAGMRDGTLKWWCRYVVPGWAVSTSLPTPLSFLDIQILWPTSHLLRCGPETLWVNSISICVLSSPLADSGLPWWLSGKESACQRERCGFDPWVR